MSDQRNCIDRYEVHEILGRGAMGVVYRAIDPVIGRVVALKTICAVDDLLYGPPGEDSIERFAREARAAGLLSHPNIVTIYDVGQMADTGIAYIAMEFVEGRTLRQQVPAGGILAPENVVDVALQVARALDYAHRRGIIHRDVKPANILIRDDGLVKLTDFGVASMGASDLTRTGESVGSPSYIAPEMLLDQPLDGRADLFSLGVVLYELLTGVKPFTGDTLAALYHKVLAQMPEPPSKLNAGVTEEWDAIIMKLLAKLPEGRHENAQHLIDDLRALETGSMPPHAMSYLRVTDQLPEILIDSDVQEIELERVIAEGTGEATHSRPFPAHMKALLALATVAGFAVTVILAAALFRPLPAKASIQPVVPAPAVATAPPAPAPVDLTVRVAHNLKEAVLTVEMDGEKILTESIKGARSKMRMQGSLARHLPIPEGRHQFTVSVQEAGGKRWTTATTRKFAAGHEATLFVEVKGVMRKTLDVTWY